MLLYLQFGAAMSFLSDLINLIADILSCISFGISLFLLNGIAKLKREFVVRTSGPVLLKKLRGNVVSMNSRLDAKAYKKADDHAARAVANLAKASEHINGGAKTRLISLEKEIRGRLERSSSADGGTALWKASTSFVEAIEILENDQEERKLVTNGD